MLNRVAAALILICSAPAVAQDEPAETEAGDAGDAGDTTNAAADAEAAPEEEAPVKKKKKKKQDKKDKKVADIVRSLDFESFMWSSISQKGTITHPDGSVTGYGDTTKSLSNNYDSSFALTLEHPSWFFRLANGAPTEFGRTAYLFFGKQAGIRTYGAVFRYLDTDRAVDLNHGSDNGTVTTNGRWMLGPYFKINSKRWGERVEWENWLAFGGASTSQKEDGNVTSSEYLSGWNLSTRLYYVKPVNPGSSVPVFYTGGFAYTYESNKLEYGDAGDRKSAQLSVHQLNVRLLGLRLQF